MTGPERLPDGPASARRRPPGLFSFTIEGRRAPGLFVVGWLATLVGAGLLVVGLGASGLPATVFTLLGLAGLAGGLTALAGSQAVEARGLEAGAPGEGAGPSPLAPPAPGGYVGPSPVLVFAAAIPLALLLSVAAVPILGLLGLASDSPVGAFAGLLATAAAYLGLVRLVVVGTRSLSWAEMGLRRPRSLGRELLYGAMLAVPVLYGSGLLALLLGTVFSLPEPPLPPAGDPFGRAVNLITGAILAPVVEEIFFRGFVTTAWLRRYGPQGAIVRGAVFFAFAHVLTVGGETFAEGLERAAFAFVVRIPIALLLGWLFVRRGSLAAAIGCHATFNGLPLVAAAVGG